MYIAISKNVVGENGEWQLSNGDCTTERNCGFHLCYANFQSLRCPWSEMDTPTVDVPLRVLDSSNKRNSHFFQLKSIPRFGNVLELKQFILQHYQNETKAKDTSFELGYFAGNRRFNITNELHLSEAMSLEHKGHVTLWIDVMPSQKRKNTSSSMNSKNKKTCGLGRLIEKRLC